MSITKEAIQHLEQTKLLLDVNEALAEISTSDPIIALPSGIEMKSLETYMPERSSYRFVFSTELIASFGVYCKEFDKVGAKCFINSEDMSAQTILDLGTETTPLHQRHKANLELKKTAAFKALLAVDGLRMKQKDAADFVDDWADNIKVIASSGDHMTPAQAANRLREISIDQVRNIESKVSDFGESMSAFEKIEAKNQETIPASIEFVCDPYHGLQPRSFGLRLSILTGEDKPIISLRIVKLEAQQEDMAEEFKDILVETFDGCKIQTLIGIRSN